MWWASNPMRCVPGCKKVSDEQNDAMIDEHIKNMGGVSQTRRYLRGYRPGLQ